MILSDPLQPSVEQHDMLLPDMSIGTQAGVHDLDTIFPDFIFYQFKKLIFFLNQL